MDLSKFLEWLKLSPRYLVPIAIVTAILLFSPTPFLEKLGLSLFVIQFRAYLSIVFLLSSVLILANWVLSLFEWLRKQIEGRKRANEYYKRLESLSDEEKDLLRGYIDGNTKTQYFSVSDGVVNGLEALKIIYRSSTVGYLNNWSYNINPWVWNHLHDHPELLYKRSDKRYTSYNSSRRRRI
jgi:hypothetical protein